MSLLIKDNIFHCPIKSACLMATCATYSWEQVAILKFVDFIRGEICDCECGTWSHDRVGSTEGALGTRMQKFKTTYFPIDFGRVRKLWHFLLMFLRGWFCNSVDQVSYSVMSAATRNTKLKRVTYIFNSWCGNWNQKYFSVQPIPYISSRTNFYSGHPCLQKSEEGAVPQNV